MVLASVSIPIHHRYHRLLRAFLCTFYRYGIGTAFYECLHYGRVTPRYWRWSLAWLRWPRDFVRYRLRGQPWGDAFHFAWLDAARDTMLLIGTVRGRLLYRRVVT